MADIDTFTVKLAELLRHPDDLDKIPALKAEFTRKKAAVDSQLKGGLKEQLEVTQSGMGAINESQRIVAQIKEEMMKIDRLCAESQNLIKDFPNINEVSTIHRNISLVQTMKNNISTFHERLQAVEQALIDDEQDMENQPQLLNIHYELTKLREIRDDAMDQMQQVKDTDSQARLDDHFDKLDEVVQLFDFHIETACMNMIPFVQADNKSMVVRLALIIEEEEKNDLKVQAMQDAQKEHKALASKFKSMKTGPKHIHGYKDKFLAAIGSAAQAKFEKSYEKFLEDPDKLEKSLKWYFNDLNTVKLGMVGLMPKKWKIYRTYTTIYHKAMHDWLIKMVDDDQTSSMHILAIIHWREKYYEKMGRLGWSTADLQPDLLDDREQELVRDWRQLIVDKVEEWMNRLFATDKQNFLSRAEDALEKDADGYFRTKTLADMWRMLREQLVVAGDSGRPDVVEGVLDEMFRALTRRHKAWNTLIDEETEKYTRPNADAEGLQSLQDWLIALANDQVVCIADQEDQTGYLTKFKKDYESLISPQHAQNLSLEVETIRDGYLDLSTAAIGSFCTIIFQIDLRATISEFFTPKWYSEYGMKRITSTFEDYAQDYADVIHYSLLDVLLEELGDKLLVHYLQSVRNRGAKFRRADQFAAKISDDVKTVWGFFDKYPTIDHVQIKQKWRAVHHMVMLLEVEKAGVPAAYEDLKREFHDVHLSWVESVLRSRDDYERSMMTNVKTAAAGIYVDAATREAETIMSKVK